MVLSESLLRETMSVFLGSERSREFFFAMFYTGVLTRYHLTLSMKMAILPRPDARDRSTPLFSKHASKPVYRVSQPIPRTASLPVPRAPRSSAPTSFPFTAPSSPAPFFLAPQESTTWIQRRVPHTEAWYSRSDIAHRTETVPSATWTITNSRQCHDAAPR